MILVRVGRRAGEHSLEREEGMAMSGDSVNRNMTERLTFRWKMRTRYMRKGRNILMDRVLVRIL